MAHWGFNAPPHETEIEVHWWLTGGFNALPIETNTEAHWWLTGGSTLRKRKRISRPHRRKQVLGLTGGSLGRSAPINRKRILLDAASRASLASRARHFDRIAAADRRLRERAAPTTPRKGAHHLIANYVSREPGECTHAERKRAFCKNMLLAFECVAKHKCTDLAPTG